MKTTVAELYRGPVSVWVEDLVTHAVLTEVWADKDISVHVSDGKPGVIHMVNASPRDRHVFGVVDRDFEEGNEDRWSQAGLRVFRLPAHELENLLLDFEVLAVLSGRADATAIEARAHERAREMVFWMVCCRVLADMQRELGKGFPPAPSDAVGLKSLAEVKRHLDESVYWTVHGPHWRRWSSGPDRGQALEAASQVFQRQLETDEWKRSFSGKELLRHLRSHVPGLDKTPRRPPQPTQLDRDLNLAKEISRKLRDLGRQPPALVTLRSVLRARAGLP